MEMPVKRTSFEPINLLFIGAAVYVIFAVTTVFAVTPALEPVGDYGAIDWVGHKLVASGVGTPPSDTPNPMRAKTLAQRAAVIVAQRNLLEVVKGVHIDSTTVVEDFMAVDDTIVAKVKGVLAGAYVENMQILADGAIKVTMGMPLKGELAELLLQMAPVAVDQAAIDSLPAQVHHASSDTQLDGQTVHSSAAPTGARKIMASSAGQLPGSASIYTGLLIDARGTGFQPCFKPNIYGRQKLLYPDLDVNLSGAIDDGFVRFYRDMGQAQQSRRISPHPYVIKAVKTADNQRSLIVSPEAFDMLQSARSAPDNFLTARRVVIVY